MSAFRTEPPIRRLAAILVADVAGYARLMDRNEERTHARLRLLQSDVIEPLIALHAGCVIRLYGDGMLVIFPSATAALLCAVQTQRQVFEIGKALPAEERLQFRIGINVADILIDEREIAGGGVNLAARLEALAEPGGICVSQTLKDQIHGDIGVNYLDAGLRRVKNIERPVRIFHVVWGRRPALTQMRHRFARFASSSFRLLIGGGALVLLLLALAWTQSAPSPEARLIRLLSLTQDAGGARGVVSRSPSQQTRRTMLQGRPRTSQGPPG